MYYHSRLILSDGKSIIKINGGLEWFKQNYIIPIFNNQTILVDYYGSEFVVNMGTISRFYIFQTKEKLNVSEAKLIKLFESKEYIENNCTKEVLDSVRKELSSNQTKSLLEKSFSTIENQVFVIMKFGDEVLDSAFEGVIEPCVAEYGLTTVRVDKIQDSGKINDQILENIAKSKFVISDLSGERPNCYYETGFSHALGKELILMIRENERIHFDLAGYRFITWKTEADLRRKLRERLKSLLENN